MCDALIKLFFRKETFWNTIFRRGISLLSIQGNYSHRWSLVTPSRWVIWFLPILLVLWHCMCPTLVDRGLQRIDTRNVPCLCGFCKSLWLNSWINFTKSFPLLRHSRQTCIFDPCSAWKHRELRSNPRRINKGASSLFFFFILVILCVLFDYAGIEICCERLLDLDFPDEISLMERNKGTLQDHLRVIREY